MTAPVRGTQLGTNWDQTLGVDSEVGRQEWDEMMRRRQQMVDSIEARWTMTRQLGGTPMAKQTADNLANRQQTLPDPDVDQEYLNKLLGAAQFYGIPNPEKIPPQALQKVVEARRMTLQDGTVPLGVVSQIGQGTAGALIGTAQELVGMAQHVPWIGQVLAKRAETQKISQKLAYFNEGMRAGLTPEDTQGYDAAHKVGELGTYLYVGSKVFQAAEAIAPIASIGARVGAINRVAGIAAKGAATGALTQVALEGGNPNSTLGAEAAKGAAGGAIFSVAAPAFMSVLGKLRSSFGTIIDNVGAIDTPYSPYGSGTTVDAELIPPDRIGAGSQRVLSGPVSSGPLPGEPLPTVGQGPFAPSAPPVQRQLPGTVPPEVLPPNKRLNAPTIIAGDGRLPASRQLMAPFETAQAPEYTPQSNDLFNHYSNMAAGLAETNPELAASMRQVAQEFAPPAQSNAPFDPRSILTDREGYDPANIVPRAPDSPNAMANIDAIQTNLANIKGGKGGGAPTVASAAVSGANVTKQSAILESPILGDIAQQPKFDDADVAKSLMASNPGAVQVIQNIGDAGKTIRQLVQEQASGRLMPHTFRIVPIEIPGGGVRNDLLVTDGMPITPKRVAQYKATGMFEGQRVTLAGGHEVTVVTPAASGNFATVRSSGGLEMAIPADDIMPGKTSNVTPKDLGIHDAQQLYNDFRNEIIHRNNSTNAQVGNPQFGWLDPETTSMLPQDLESFLDSRGIESPVVRNALHGYFDHARVKDFQATSPEELEQMRSINRLASIRLTEAAARANRAPSLDEIASAKNFRWEPNPGTEGGDLVDVGSSTRFPMEHEDAAKAFLKSNDRELPDVTPITDVPMEVMEAPPGGVNPGDDTPAPVETPQVLDNYHFAAQHIDDMTAELEQNLRDRSMEGAASPPPGVPREFSIDSFSRRDEGNGSAPPPPPPSLPPTQPPFSPPPPPPSFGQRSLPPSDESVGAQFARAKIEKPRELSEAMKLLDGLWLRYGAPFRALTLKMQNSLDVLGIKANRLWENYADIVNNRTVAHNQASPYHKEWNEIMGAFPSRWVSDGTVAKIEEIGDFNAKIAAMKRHGYTDKQIAAQGRIRDWFDRVGQEFGVKGYLFNYIPHIRMRAGMPGVDDAISGMLPNELDFFGDHLRQGGINLRQMDMNVLGHQYARAVSFDRNVAPHWNAMREKWNDPRIPEPMRNLVEDWLQVVRTGHNPGYSPMIQGVRQFMNTMGLPATDHDVSAMWSFLFRNIYRAALGWNPAPIFRDSIQPYLTGTKIGFQPINEAYATLMKGGEAAAAMIQRGLDNGWLEKGAVRTANQDAFAGPGDLDAGGNSLLTDNLRARREAIANIVDHLRDLLPRKYRHGIQGTMVDPVYGYMKLQEVNRIVSGEAGWNLATRAIAKFRANAPDGFAGDMGQLVSESKASAYDTPIRNRFIELVQQGQDSEAAKLLANEAANLQFRGGIVEAPIGLRSPVGRAAMMFGNFTQQYIQTMKEGLSAGAVPDRVGFALRHGIVMGALSVAQAYTRWKFSKWMWHSALSFSGGPLISGVRDLASTVGGLAAKLTGFRPTSDQQDALQAAFGKSSSGSDILNLINPARGALTTATNFGNGLNSAEGLPAALRATIMNQPRGADPAPDWRQGPVQAPPGGQPVLPPSSTPGAGAMF